MRTLVGPENGKSPLAMRGPRIPWAVSYETPLKRALTCEFDAQKVISYSLSVEKSSFEDNANTNWKCACALQKGFCWISNDFPMKKFINAWFGLSKVSYLFMY